jgi:hypothetical protein
MKPRPQYIAPMNSIDVRFDRKAIMQSVRKDLRAMRRTDPVMYWSVIGAMFFLTLDVLTMAGILVYISII